MPNRPCLPPLLLLGCLGCAALPNDHDGCGSRALGFIHAIHEPPPHLVAACRAVPAERRDRVQLFAINGMDPLYLGNLNGLCGCIRQLGFPNVRCCPASQCRALRAEIGERHRQAPACRVALLGYSLGAVRARDLCSDLNRDGVPVELLVYLGGDTIENVPASRPPNVAQVLNITGHGYLPRGGDLFYNGCHLDGATNRRLNARHMLLPTRPETVELLTLQLVAVAQAPP